MSGHSYALTPDVERSSTPFTSKSSVSDKFSLAAHPSTWGSTRLLINEVEDDDYLHNPDKRIDSNGHIFTARGCMNLGFLALLVLGLMMLFAGFPVMTYLTTPKQTTQGGFNLGGTNSTGQIPYIGNFGLIDIDTPKSAYTRKAFTSLQGVTSLSSLNGGGGKGGGGEDWQLVFSDEFETEGRRFYPGDDPYWEAVDLHYWGTGDLEWYDPSGATTANGALKLTLEKVDPATNHNLSYRSGMVQTWNKFCFTGGILETAVTLPGINNIAGLWPAVWAMGNLGRAGFGASLDGLWPYSYDTCDVGTLPNQTYPGTLTPIAATINGDSSKANGMLSYLSGQRLSRCTCPGESHPGPVHKNGEFVGRAAPEIDVFEALIDSTGTHGESSQSAQWAPMGAAYGWDNSSANAEYYNDAYFNLYFSGNAWQQTTSGLSLNNQDCYELTGGCYGILAFEYRPGFDDGYIAWVNDNKLTWIIHGKGMKADADTEIGPRIVSEEPMYIIANLGFSEGFGAVDFDHITFPTTMSIDYIRVYQRPGEIRIGCDPPDHPTAAYIKAYEGAYTNPNYTTWEQYGQPQPKNRLQNGGKC